MPAPGGQNSMPYFFPADSKKSKTSLFPVIERGKSVSAPFSLNVQISKAHSQEDQCPSSQVRGSATLRFDALVNRFTYPTIIWSVMLRTKSVHVPNVCGTWKLRTTVYTRRHRSTRQSARHELQKCHLRTRILHSHAIRLQLQIRPSPDIPTIFRIREQGLLRLIKMRVQNLLRQRQLPRRTQHASDFFQLLDQLCVGWRARCDVGFALGGNIVCGRKMSSCG